MCYMTQKYMLPDPEASSREACKQDLRPVCHFIVLGVVPSSGFFFLMQPRLFSCPLFREQDDCLHCHSIKLSACLLKASAFSVYEGAVTL